MIIIGVNENWTITITDNVSASVTTTDDGWIVKRSSIERLIASNPPALYSPLEYYKVDTQWNAEKKRREIAGIRAAQRKHEIAKHSACKITRKVLKYYREPNIRKEVIISQANESSAGKRAKASNNTRRRRKR